MNIYSKQKKHPLRVSIIPSKLHTNDYFILSERPILRKTHLDSATLHLDGFATQIYVHSNTAFCK